VLLAIPSASRRRRNEILKRIRQHPLAVRTLPSLTDLAEGRVTTSDLRELDIDDLLGRDSVAPNHILLAKNITNKVVLVTGAGVNRLAGTMSADYQAQACQTVVGGVE